MILELGFGPGVQTVSVPDENILGILAPNAVTVDLTGEAEVKRALEAPIGSPRLKDMVKPGEKIAIITSDITRPCPSYKMLPALLDELYAGGVAKEDITLVFALGSHRKHTDAEKLKLAGGVVNSPFWTQMFADVAGIPVETAEKTELGCKGAAMSAGIAAGIFRDAQEAVASCVKAGSLIYPDPAMTAVYRRKYAIYRKTEEALRPVWQAMKAFRENAD